MLNEKRVKHMVKLAFYDEKRGEQDIKISSFFRKDYVNYNVLRSLLWVTLGYLSLTGLICLAIPKKIMENMPGWGMMAMAALFVVGFLAALVLYGVGAVRFYRKKHRAAKIGVKRYLRDLEILEKMYEREEAS